MKPKVYESFAEQKIDQRIGFCAFLIVNLVMWPIVWLLSGRATSTIIALLPWVVNGLLLIWAAIFRRYIAGGYLVGLGGTLVVGAILGLIGVVAFFLSFPLSGLLGPIGDVIFLALALGVAIWFILKVIPIFRSWWAI